MNRRRAIAFTLLILAIAAIAIARLTAGSNAWGWPSDSDVLHLRLNRLCSGGVVGAALALAGVLLQSLLRNPLASPDIIGANAGAGFAVMLTTYIAWLTGGTLFSTPGYHSVIGGISVGAALLGSLGALALVYSLGQRRGFVEPVSLVLVGVMVSVTTGAGTMLISNLMPDRGMAVARWMSGSLGDDASPAAVISTAVLAIVVLGLSIAFARRLDIGSLSDDEARSLGVNVAAQRILVFFATGLLTAGAVVIAGPIGFVGLVCPHVGRILVGPGHRALVPAAAMLGIILIVGADVLVRVIDVQSGRLPIGVVTAIIGGPLFLWLLRRERGAVWAG